MRVHYYRVLPGQHLHLVFKILGIETKNRVTVMVPAGEVITILGGPRPDDKRLVNVSWGCQELVMFYEDIQERGYEVTEGGA